MAINRVYTVPLPLDCGSRDVDFGKFTEELKEKAIAHGLKQKLGDLAAKYKLQNSDTKEKDGNRYFDSEEERKTALVIAADGLIERWYAGEWNQDGSGRGISEIDGYRFAVIFKYLDIAPKDQATRRKAGMENLIRSYAIKQTGKATLKGKALQSAIETAAAEIDRRAMGIKELLA